MQGGGTTGGLPASPTGRSPPSVQICGKASELDDADLDDGSDDDVDDDHDDRDDHDHHDDHDDHDDRDYDDDDDVCIAQPAEAHK